MERIFTVTVGGYIRKYLDDDTIIRMAKEHNYAWMSEGISLTSTSDIKHLNMSFVVIFNREIDRIGFVIDLNDKIKEQR